MVMRTTGASETVTIPCQNVGTFNATIDWGDGQTSDITAYNDADLSHVYATAGDHTIRISGTFPNIYFNNTGHKAKLIKVLQLGDVGWVTLEKAFYGCFAGGSGAEYEFTAGPCNTSSVNTMQHMMREWSSMTASPDLTGLDTSSVNTMRHMMSGWTSMMVPPDLTGLDTSSVTSMSAMMLGWTSMTASPDLTGLDTSSVTDMSFMMRNWFSMTSPPDLTGFDTSSVTSMAVMMSGWSSMTIGDIGVASFNLGLVTNLTGFAEGSAFTTEAYDAILTAWNAQDPVNGLSVHFGSSQYTSGGAAEAARASLISSDSWTITDGGAA